MDLSFWSRAENAPHAMKTFFSITKKGKVDTIKWKGHVMILGLRRLMTHYLKNGQAIIGDYYWGLLIKLLSQLKRKKHRKLRNGAFLQHDDTPEHWAQAVQTSEQCSFEFLPHPAYSQDLDLSNFFSFPLYEYRSKDAISMTTMAPLILLKMFRFLVLLLSRIFEGQKEVAEMFDCIAN